MVRMGKRIGRGQDRAQRVVGGVNSMGHIALKWGQYGTGELEKGAA